MQTQTKFRLLVVRLGAMGDILHALPAVTALRAAHPGWIIDWVIEPRWRALLEAAQPAAGHTDSAGFVPGKDSDRANAASFVSGHDFSRADASINATGVLAPARRSAASITPFRPIVDQLHLAPTREWRKKPFTGQTVSEIRKLRRSLILSDYDTVLDLQGAIRSAVIGRFAGCQRLIGPAHPRERAARWLYTEDVETQGAHVIEQGVELAAAVAGDDLKPVAPRLPVEAAAEAWADVVLPPGSPSAALMNPGAGWGAKRWPAERYAAVARGLTERGLQVLVNAGPGEESLAAEIVQTTDSEKVRTVACSLEQLIALTRRVRLAIGGDTGPMHLASALGRPVVGIYGPTDPARNGPYGAPFRVLRSPQSRRDHTRHQAPEAGLLTITPEEVLGAVADLLSEAHKGGKEPQ